MLVQHACHQNHFGNFIFSPDSTSNNQLIFRFENYTQHQLWIILFYRYRPGRTMEITGWGKVLKVGGENKRSLSSPNTLQEATVPIISQKRCQDDNVCILATYFLQNNVIIQHYPSLKHTVSTYLFLNQGLRRTTNQ